MVVIVVAEKISAHIFKRDGKWYMTSMKVEETNLNSNTVNSCHVG
jgi:hypothetical protein